MFDLLGCELFNRRDALLRIGGVAAHELDLAAITPPLAFASSIAS